MNTFSAQQADMTVADFFRQVNWENHPPAVQQLKQALFDADQPPSLLLPVCDFFSTFPWEGAVARSTPVAPALPSPGTPNVTLEDFSSFF